MKGYKVRSSANEVRTAFKGWSPLIQQLLEYLPDEVERWSLVGLPPVNDWVHTSGRTVLLGDAAHTTLPYLAQDAPMAIEDAATLGAILARVEEIGDLPKLLSMFYELRVKRAHSMQRKSWTNRFFIHMGQDPVLGMREALFRAGDYPESPNSLGNTLFQGYLCGFDATSFAEQAYTTGFRTKVNHCQAMSPAASMAVALAPLQTPRWE